MTQMLANEKPFNMRFSLMSFTTKTTLWFFIEVNAISNNNSFILLQSVLLVEETGVPGENQPSDKNYW